MVGTADPYYTRKPVPDDLIKDVGVTDLTPEQEFWNRERKYSLNGADVRKFSKSKKGGMEPQDDPYYGRKPLSKAEIVNVGTTGLTPEEEYWNRERKYSVNGVDARRFSNSRKGGMVPLNDPYYGRKPVSNVEIQGLGETGLTLAEEFEVRERKQSLFQLSSDPFDIVAGRHRQSVSGIASGASAAATRRRSSAIAPDAHAAMASHSGYQGDKLAPIESKPELPPVDLSRGSAGESSTVADESTAGPDHEQARRHDAATWGLEHIYHDDPDSVAPHEVR